MLKRVGASDRPGQLLRFAGASAGWKAFRPGLLSSHAGGDQGTGRGERESVGETFARALRISTRELRARVQLRAAGLPAE